MKPSTVVIAVLALILGYTTLFQVKETERAVKLQFGRIVNSDLSPGLHLKMPWEKVLKFDSRVITLDAKVASYRTKDEERLEVDSYLKWKIADVDSYYKSTGGDELVAAQRLEARINDELRNEFSNRTLNEAISGERDQLMEKITQAMDTLTRESLGIEIVDVRVKRIDFPDTVSESVYKEMSAERKKEATQNRSEGREQELAIRADADRQKVVIEAEAYREAELLRGAGDARAAAIYAEAFNKDKEFYAFLRSLEAYRESFNNKGDMMLVDPDSEFFRYLKDSKGK